MNIEYRFERFSRMSELVNFLNDKELGPDSVIYVGKDIRPFDDRYILLYIVEEDEG